MDKITGNISPMGKISGNITPKGTVNGNVTYGNGYITDYELLSNLPQIEGVTLIGNKTFPQLHLEAISNTEIEELLT